ncbi:hypothetical protein VHEMI05683 [[Torrubiella] hemipterigena]|nr:hypothetical protein VHEMI05683 [[Torrubiella] hemipterigena]
MCALASISYADASGRNYLVDDGFSYKWADQASVLVLSELMSPTENTLVSLINLTLFWYCQGHWKRSFVLGLNCIGVIRVLGLEDLVSNNEASLTAEISRRRLWGALILSITSGRDDVLTMTGPVMQALPLPCDDDAFARGEVSLPLLTMTDNGRSPSFFAEFIRIFNLWQAVHMFVQDTKLHGDDKSTKMQSLDARLHEWNRNLPSRFLLTPSNIGSASSVIVAQIVLLHIHFHQCLCVLHSSVVPLFTFGAASDVQPHFQSVSAQLCFDHANQISSTFELALDWCTSHAYGFVGYAAYCATAIQLPFLQCSDETISLRALANIAVNNRVIHGVAKRWRFVAGLEKHIKVLRQYHESYGSTLADRPVGLPSSQLNESNGSFTRTRASILTHNDLIFSTKSLPDDDNDSQHLNVDKELEEWLQNQAMFTQHFGDSDYMQCGLLLEPFYLLDDLNVFPS